MLILDRGQQAQFKFVFVSEGNIYDPTSAATPIDVVFYVIRGDFSNGPIVDGPFSYLSQLSIPDPNVYIEKTNGYEFTLNYKVPINLFEGVYSVVAQTTDLLTNLNITSRFQVKGDPIVLNPVVLSSANSGVINYKADYQDLAQSNTSTILLLGHADGLELNTPIKVRSMQSAIDLLGADIRSPLLRAVFDSYAAGARDIIICAVAPMSEYVEKVVDRNTSTTIFDLASATPASYTFYEKYYERLATTYSSIKELDFIDMIVPVEASIIKTDGVDFITQLANYLSDFHNTTGFVQLGIIGSRTDGLSSSDISLFQSNSIFENKLTQYNNITGNISSDIGRFVIPVYGEGIYQHSQLKTSYVSSIAPALAGMLASTSLRMALIRTRIPGITSVLGSDLTQSDHNILESLGINTIYRGKKTRRSIPNEVYITNEYTMAHPRSTLAKAAQMRIISRVVSEVRGYSYEAIGRFGYDKTISNVRMFLESLKSERIILDFSFNVEVGQDSPGHLIFYIELISALGLKKVSFAVSTGPGA